ncbi:hypothetical protein ACN267_09380 [Micromonospora sp. WMMD734]|uniref:hypothetical protein n=1 Tax=Micromonospora sp. WMMD734 TaxID=3404129 RepID=UPI003B94C30D
MTVLTRNLDEVGLCSHCDNAQRGEAVPTAALAISTRLTPYTALPRRLPWFAGARWRERLANVLIFASVPTALFWAWYLADGNNHIPPQYDLLFFTVPLSALFTLIGPIAFQQGEFVYERLLRTISQEGTEGGWNIAEIQQRVDQLDRFYYRITIPLSGVATAATGYVFYQIRDIAPIKGTAATLGALVVLAFTGLTTGTGLWGAAKVALIVNTITKTADPKWSPFRESQGIHELFRFAWSTGVLFSLSNITVPALLVVMPRLPQSAKVISISFIALTFVGGMLLFTLTSRWLFALTSREHDQELERLAPTLERFADQIPAVFSMSTSEVIRLRHGLEATLLLRQQIEQTTPAPISHRTVLAATTTLVIPVMLTLLQTIASKL